MSRAIGYVCLGVVLAAAGMGWSASAQQSAPVAGFAGVSSRELVTNFQTPANGPTALTIVDPQTRVVAVYHIIRETGEIQLKSVRNINADMTLEGYNSGGTTGSLSPIDVRKMIEQQK